MAMDRLRALLRSNDEDYTPLAPGSETDIEDTPAPAPSTTFRLAEYLVFVLLGISQLWAYNMFLAAGPYLSQRFSSSAWIADNFQAAQLAVSNVTNLATIILLTHMQKGASYTTRIFAGLVINVAAFSALAVSTLVATGVSAEAYFGFVLAMVLASSLTTALFQNGIFAYVAGFGQHRYTQGIMVGQGIAGVLPCVAQVGLTLGFGGRQDGQPAVSAGAAFTFFATAVGISVVTLFAFSYLVRRQRVQRLKMAVHAELSAENTGKVEAVPMLVLLKKLRWPAATVFITFVITIQFPVFTQIITSVVPLDRAKRIQEPASFIPIAFLFWNTGDLVGRVISTMPKDLVTKWPRWLFAAAVGRVIFLGLYELCNIRGRGAVISSDTFYLLVQLLFGITNGYIGSACMMGAGDWVDVSEREAAGGFMGLCLISGLAVGSFLSFLAAGA